MRILFLLKRNQQYGNYTSTAKSGLLNSAQLTASVLHDKLGEHTIVEVCIDANEIDKFLVRFKPNLCIIEALWVTPEKLRELQGLHCHIKFVVLIHSEIPFLANEGIAIERIKAYDKIPNVSVGFNSHETFTDMLSHVHAVYLPNIYPINFERFKRRVPRKFVKIACFGALRPMKNQLAQAFAAIKFGDDQSKVIEFHINGTRMEQGGGSVLKNIRALFNGSKHRLVEHNWMDRCAFKALILKMDIGLQVSFTESFNIVAADFVSQAVPIIVSDTISWMPGITKAELSVSEIACKIGLGLENRRKFARLSQAHLALYSATALATWRRFLIVG